MTEATDSSNGRGQSTRLPFGPWVVGGLLVLLLAVVLVAPGLACPAPAEAATVQMTGMPATYQGHSYAGSRDGNASEDKPQSKVWWNDGSWWALMVSAASRQVHVFELLPDHSWRDTGVLVDDRPDSTGDALWDGSRLYVASRQATSPLRVQRLSYDPSTRQYSADEGFPVTVGAGGSPSATIAKDGTGRLWATWTQDRRVWVAHSLDDEAHWSAPFVPPVMNTTLAADDRSAIVAFGGRVGVMWSDRVSGAYRFAVHVDATPAEVWSSETPLVGAELTDDHINLRTLSADASGRLHAVVKTGLDQAGGGSGDPIVLVLTRSPEGTWTHAVVATVADLWTRPVLVLDETNGELHVLANSGSRIVVKTSPLADIAFPTGKGQVFMEKAGTYLNDPSSSKHPVTADTGLVVLASSTTDLRYYHAELAVRRPPDVQPPSTPTGLAAVVLGPSSVRLSWSAASDDTEVLGYRVHRDGASTVRVGGTGYTDTGLEGSTSYRYQVEAYDTAGNVSPATPVVVATTDEAVGVLCRGLGPAPHVPDLELARAAGGPPPAARERLLPTVGSLSAPQTRGARWSARQQTAALRCASR